MTLTEAATTRFWAKVDTSGECWTWTGARAAFGYGMFAVAGRPTGAHRVSYELAYGSIPEGMVVRHKCDNPPCVRPEHLEVGTKRDNSRDTIDRGRYNPASGDGWVNIRQAALELGIDASTIRRQIARGKISGRRFRGSPWHIRWSEIRRYQDENQANRRG